MKILKHQFLWFSAALLALALPAASEPRPDLADNEEIIIDEEIYTEESETPAEQGARPVMASAPGMVRTGTRSVRAGAAPVAGAMTQQQGRGVVSRQPGNLQPAFNSGRVVSGRSAVNTGQVNANTAQRSATTSRPTANAATPRSGEIHSRTTGRTGAVQTAPAADSARTISARTPGTTASGVNTARASVITSVNKASPAAARRSNNTARNATADVVDPSVEKYSKMRQEVENLKTEMNINNDKAEVYAQVYDNCEARFFGCMDDICERVSDEMGRCACSPNADTYKENAEALKQAKIDLQDTVQNIQYLGLTAEEVNSLFTITEAEGALEANQFGGGDQSELKKMIMGIRDNIPDINNLSSTSSGILTSSTGWNLDADFSIMTDMNSFTFGNVKGNQFNDISGMTGGDLYKSAKNVCQTIMNECKKNKVDVDLMQAKYDVEVGKACVDYKGMLEDQTQSLKTLNRNAKYMLERARFSVHQNKNALDLKGCVLEIDKCMQDDFVCGKDYKKCLDPTGQYISVDSKVVPGADLPVGQIRLWGARKSAVNYSELAGLGATSKDIVSVNGAAGSTNYLVNMLTSKVGEIDKLTGNATSGYCAGVMRQCQRFSYDSNAQYNSNNLVIKNYVYMALPKIMSAQDTMISNYRTQCTTDLKQCYQTQLLTFNTGQYYGGQINGSQLTWAHLNSALYACDNIGLSCAFTVFSGADNLGETDSSATAKQCPRYIKCDAEKGTCDNKATFDADGSAQICSRSMMINLIQGLLQCNGTYPKTWEPDNNAVCK
ncbi:MAG: hypothetical protein LBB23_03260 [Rickettsiales bacterium]|jgi:hypothetical protein|nr:hypothetical protein [Rickettsiales bacterium]